MGRLRNRPDMIGKNNPMNRPEVIEKFKGKNNPFYGKKHSEETKRKMREAKLGKKNLKVTGDKHGNWKGGIDYTTWHNKAWEQFGKDYCENCGMTNDNHLIKFNTRLHMHCEDHEYSNLTKENWKCVCVICHGGIDG